ncbi:hypothetical protein AB4Z45_32355 [Paenibacillus sp. MCAF9]|uniref:hypothetical protein n=1 Tax=unclassified Paenibacillus TaxID=185978 RepID=UPI003F9DEB88
MVGISTKAVIPIDTKKDGKWSASTSLIYQGLSSTGQEFKYDLYTEYNRDGQPNYYFSDSVVQYWDNATGISSASSYGANNWLPKVNNTIQQEAMTIVRKFGQSQGTFDLKHSHHNYGVIVDDLRVPRTLRGTNKQILASYAHPYIPGFVSVLMGIAGMSWPGLIGDDWYLDGTFTVQNT